LSDPAVKPPSAVKAVTCKLACHNVTDAAYFQAVKCPGRIGGGLRLVSMVLEGERSGDCCPRKWHQLHVVTGKLLVHMTMHRHDLCSCKHIWVPVHWVAFGYPGCHRMHRT
jgi:hypothetical protein